MLYLNLDKKAKCGLLRFNTHNELKVCILKLHDFNKFILHIFTVFKHLISYLQDFIVETLKGNSVRFWQIIFFPFRSFIP